MHDTYLYQPTYLWIKPIQGLIYHKARGNFFLGSCQTLLGHEYSYLTHLRMPAP